VTNRQRMIVAHTKPMGILTRLFHWTMIGLTLGLWWPIYRASKTKHGE
jgi:hypothetical protein